MKENIVHWIVFTIIIHINPFPAIDRSVRQSMFSLL